MLKKMTKAFTNPGLVLVTILNFRLFRLLPDELFIKIKHYIKTQEKLNLAEPTTFNEKLQWLKLHDRNPNYTTLVDKVAVREVISDEIGQHYLIPSLGVYNSFEDINFEQLPNQFVLKANHTSGDVFVCKDKSSINYEKLKQEIEQWMKRNYYWDHREWPYKNIKPKILCEKYMVDESESELKDYKILCFNGEPKLIQVMSNRRRGYYNINHYDINWQPVSIKRKKFDENPEGIPKPVKLHEMVDISRKLSKGMPFARIDLYNTGSQVFFGEITFYPVSGYMDFAHKETNLLLGSWIDLDRAYSKKVS
ncbi:ATP-grasp fold amidoligase family protein [Alkalibacterium pelagium]|uniref:TupA-like ATPgrasp n=1 Tax=Alkalibacterium pelagium TaxID=426702 RepID=A0A1H7NMP6_9LACT|nr:ATP-grasp fold amidoligase family protein [Alkalibacterium pelagium]GEN51429.1 glycosyl transferase [Alkalibacterium pelagium]SEL24782.1 TupA-like ATPgrasp [Alkalibacterium pelagium]